jgi:hypothetical protein
MSPAPVIPSPTDSAKTADSLRTVDSAMRRLPKERVDPGKRP